MYADMQDTSLRIRICLRNQYWTTAVRHTGGTVIYIGCLFGKPASFTVLCGANGFRKVRCTRAKVRGVENSSRGLFHRDPWSH